MLNDEEHGCGSIGRSVAVLCAALGVGADRKSTRLNSSHSQISYAVFCLKKKTSLSPNQLRARSPRIQLMSPIAFSKLTPLPPTAVAVSAVSVGTPILVTAVRLAPASVDW